MSLAFNLQDLFRKSSLDPSRAAAKSGTLKMGHSSATTPNQNTDQYISDSFAATEASGTNYARQTLSNVTFTMDGSGNITFDADDPATISQSASGDSDLRRCWIAYDTGTDTTSEVVGYSDDAGADYGNVAGDLDVSLNASGIYIAAR